LFYFLSSAWVCIAGNNVTAIHALYLAISVCLLWIVYFFTGKLTNKTAGLAAAMLLMTLPLFLAQASFMLPEIIVALLGLVTLLFYWRKKTLAGIITGSLLILTKESGAIMIGSILLCEFFTRSLKIKTFYDFKKTILSVFYWSVPLFVAAIFFVIQKVKLGWFFYPEHTQMIVTDKSTIITNFKNLLNFVLFEQGRFVLILLIVFSVILGLYRKKFSRPNKDILITGSIFIVLYSMFCSINFYVPRYSMAIFPVLFLMVSHILFSFSGNRNLVISSLLVLFISYSASISIQQSNCNDNNTGFLSMVRTHEEAIHYCEEKGWYNKTIQSHFLMKYYMIDPFMGYLNGDKRFENLDVEAGPIASEIVIVSQIEKSPELESVRTNPGYRLEKRFSHKKAWCEIYVRK
jgi:predicted membrane-bound dolichyl-phosphate-mannose-protein mannosyltransferase